MSKPPRIPRKRVVAQPITDPAEIAAAAERDREFRQTALGQMGCCLVIEAPLPLLAQYIVELPAGERQEFLGEVINRLPDDVLRALAEALRTRLDAPAA
jgi:hypothetical protein